CLPGGRASLAAESWATATKLVLGKTPPVGHAAEPPRAGGAAGPGMLDVPPPRRHHASIALASPRRASPGRPAMFWKGREESENVEDQRGLSKGVMVAGGGVGALLLAVVAFFLGADPSKLLNPNPRPPDADTLKAQEEQKQFVGV